MKTPVLMILGGVILLLIYCHPAAGNQDGEIRLFSGSTMSGVLQIYIKGRWTDVCKDNVNTAILRPFCREHAHLPKLKFLSDDYAGMVYYSTGPLGYSQVYVECRDSCRSLAYNPNRQCQHFMDPPVIICDRDVLWYAGSTTRLVTLEDSNLKLLQVMYNGLSLNICDKNFTSADLQVMRNTNINTSVNGTLTSMPPWFGLSWSPECTGTEYSLLDCKRNYTSGCSMNNDEPLLLPHDVLQDQSIEGALGLFGDTRTKGVLKIFKGTRWYHIGATSLTTLAARVACRQMGLPSEGATFETVAARFKVWPTGWACAGYEKRLSDCRIGWLSSTFLRGVRVTCKTGPVSRPTVVRLVGGVNNRIDGKILISYYGHTSFMCDSGFNRNAARVACRTLGSHDELAQVLPKQLTNGDGYLIPNPWEIRCNGSETQLYQCQYTRLAGRCNSKDEVAIICPPPYRFDDPITWLLVGGTKATEGRVQMTYAGYPGSVCTEFEFEDRVAKVICRYLGASRPGYDDRAVPVDWFGAGSGLVWLSGIFCTGFESSPMMCPHNQIGGAPCSNSGGRELAVQCAATPSVSASNMTGATTRLRSTTKATTTTTTKRTTSAARRTTPTTTTPTTTGPLSRKTRTTERPTESTRADIVRIIRPATDRPVHAPSKGSGKMFPGEEFQMISMDSDIRTGVVSMKLYGVWRSICDKHNMFDDNAAKVFCFSIRQPSKGARRMYSKMTGHNLPSAWRFDVRCKGNELSLRNCFQGSIMEINCSPQNIAIVHCSSSTTSDGHSDEQEKNSEWITFTIAAAALLVIVVAAGILFVTLRRRRRPRGGSQSSLLVDDANIANDYIPPKYEELFPELHTITQPGASQGPIVPVGDTPELNDDNYM